MLSSRVTGRAASRGASIVAAFLAVASTKQIKTNKYARSMNKIVFISFNRIKYINIIKHSMQTI